MFFILSSSKEEQLKQLGKNNQVNVHSHTIGDPFVCHCISPLTNLSKFIVRPKSQSIKQCVLPNSMQ